jgi:hypothetical protein
MASTPIEVNGIDKLTLLTNIAPPATVVGAVLSLDFRTTVAQPLSADPSTPVAGQFWLNTTTPKTLKYYDGALTHGIAPLDSPHFTGQVGIGNASPIATLEITGGVTGAITYGLLLDDQTAGSTVNYNIWSGPQSSTLDPEIVGYINGSLAGPNGNRNVFVNEVDGGTAFFGITQAAGGVGIYGVACATSGGNVWGFGADGVSIASGPTATIAGGWAEAGNQGTGRVDTLVGLQLLHNWNSGGGAVTTCIGLQVVDQTVGDTNYGVVIQQSPGATNYALLTTGGAQSKFDGQVDIFATSTAFRFVGKKVPIAVVAGAITLNASAASSFRVALNANVTSATITNPTDGQVIVIEWVQDATGGRTVAMPANLSGAATPTATANAVTTQSFMYDLTATTWYSVGVGSGGGGGTGTVTSVGLSLPAEFTVTGSPVSTSGALTATWASEAANKVFAAPNGAPGTPTFRLLVAADISASTPNVSVAYNALPASVNVTTEGTIDWLIWGNNITVPDQQANFGNASGGSGTYRKMTGGLAVNGLAPANSGGVSMSSGGAFPTTTFNINAGDARSVATAQSFTISALMFLGGVASRGLAFRVPCDSRQKVLRIYVSNGSPYTVNAVSSDGGINYSFSRAGTNDQIVITYNGKYDGGWLNVFVGNDAAHTNNVCIGAITLGLV